MDFFDVLSILDMYNQRIAGLGTQANSFAVDVFKPENNGQGMTIEEECMFADMLRAYTEAQYDFNNFLDTQRV